MGDSRTTLSSGSRAHLLERRLDDHRSTAGGSGQGNEKQEVDEWSGSLTTSYSHSISRRSACSLQHRYVSRLEIMLIRARRDRSFGEGWNEYVRSRACVESSEVG